MADRIIRSQSRGRIVRGGVGATGQPATQGLQFEFSGPMSPSEPSRSGVMPTAGSFAASRLGWSWIDAPTGTTEYAVYMRASVLDSWALYCTVTVAPSGVTAAFVASPDGENPYGDSAGFRCDPPVDPDPDLTGLAFVLG